jgi:hypothetical protein
MRRPAADDPAHRQIMTQPISIVHVLIVSKMTKHQLPQQANQRVATVLSGACVSEHLACKRVIESATG